MAAPPPSEQLALVEPDEDEAEPDEDEEFLHMTHAWAAQLMMPVKDPAIAISFSVDPDDLESGFTLGCDRPVLCRFDSQKEET